MTPLVAVQNSKEDVGGGEREVSQLSYFAPGPILLQSDMPAGLIPDRVRGKYNFMLVAKIHCTLRTEAANSHACTQREEGRETMAHYCSQYIGCQRNGLRGVWCSPCAAAAYSPARCSWAWASPQAPACAHCAAAAASSAAVGRR